MKIVANRNKADPSGEIFVFVITVLSNKEKDIAVAQINIIKGKPEVDKADRYDQLSPKHVVNVMKFITLIGKVEHFLL